MALEPSERRRAVRHLRSYWDARRFRVAPHLARLEADGLVPLDRLGLGLTVDLRGRAVGRLGQTIETLLVGGPLARGTFGELMGLPEVSRYAVEIAAARSPRCSQIEVTSRKGSSLPPCFALRASFRTPHKGLSRNCLPFLQRFRKLFLGPTADFSLICQQLSLQYGTERFHE